MPHINVIGQGTYGCVHRPSITCKDRKNITYKNKISKVMLNSEAEIELKEYAKIAKADIRADFFLGIPIKCKTDTNPTNLKAINRCNNGKEILSNISDYSLLVMKYGGINLEKFADEVARWKKTPENKMKFDKFLIEFQRIIIGAETFLKHDIIQHDVKPQNIVYDQAHNRMNYIDFGLMQSYKKTISSAKRSYFWLAKKPHWSYPLEIQFMNRAKYMNFVTTSTQRKIQFYKEIVEKLNRNIKSKNANAIRTLFSFIMPKSHNDGFIKKFFNDLYKTLIHELTQENYDEMATKCFKTMDGYGLGIAILYVIESADHILDATLLNELRDFGYKLLTPDLKSRYSLEDAIFAYEQILESNGILKRNHKYFDNHVLMEGTSPEQKLKRNIRPLSHTNLTLSRNKRNEYVYLTNNACPKQYEYNRKTRKCVKRCGKGYYRDKSFKCKRADSI
jgi:serine/threonine protein kinase